MAEEADPNELALIAARDELRRIRTQLAQATGGVSAASVLVHLANQLGADLAASFDDLPSVRFDGIVRADRGMFRSLRFRRIPHRVVLGRYVGLGNSGPGVKGFRLYYARIAVLGVGSDGVLRTGQWNGNVGLPEDEDLRFVTSPVLWDDKRLFGVPPRAIRMSPWTGSNDWKQVGNPGQAIDALTSLARRLADDATRNLSLLQRFV
jgi:hypothetical protein